MKDPQNQFYTLKPVEYHPSLHVRGDIQVVESMFYLVFKAELTL